MYKKFFNLRKVAMIVACLAVTTTLFASCEILENNPADPDVPVFTEFSFAGQAGDAVIDAGKRTVKVLAACGTNIAALTPDFELSPKGATATVNGKTQTSGTTVVNCGENTFFKYGLSLADIAASDNLEMPNHTDVTLFYVRSEKVMDIMCDVYKDSQAASGGTETWTWWVDPATGFTLKYERVLRDGDIESYEVTKLVVGKPDWNGKHLHPVTGDTFIDVD